MLGKRSIVGAIVIVLAICTSRAQEATCEQTLNLATEEFNSGRFYSVPGMLAECLRNGFSREQQQRAYLLLTQVYLLLDDPLAAENSYLSVLEANPEFATDPAVDPIDVVYLSKKFTASPIFSLFVRIGVNVSPVRVIHSILPSSGPVPIETRYTLKPGVQAFLGADWHYSENLALSSEVGYAFASYKRERFNVFGRDRHEFIDKLSCFSFPIMVKYSFDRFYKSRPRKFIPQAFAGIAVNYLFIDRGQVEVFNNNLGENTINTIIATSPSLDFLPYRNRLYTSYIIGGAAKYKWKLDYLFAEVRYGFGLRNLVTETTTFSGRPMQEFGHVDDYFRLDNLSVSVGFYHPLYKPRRLNRVNTKSVLKSVKKKDYAEQE
ncbi:MAG: hypothetical protein ACK4RF_09010 [Cyclobacteriaceae bacterium]